MKTITTLPGLRLAAVAFAAAGAVALAGCENPQPTAAPEEATAAPPAPDTGLMGAPTTRTPEYVGPQGSAYPPPGPPPPGPAYGQPYPPAPYGPAPYPPSAYPPGYGGMAAQGGPDQIITMKPIPNPPETGWYYGRHYGPVGEAPRHHHRIWMYGGGAAAYGGRAWRHVHRPHHRTLAPQPALPAPHRPVAPSGAAPAHPVAAASHHGAAAAGAAATALGAAQLAKPHAPSVHHHRVDEATSSAASGGPTNTVAQNTTASGTEADRYKALEAAMHDAFESAAVLNAPANMAAGQASTVTLTLPAEFAAAVQRDAAQQGLSEAAASMNLLATLAGDGYTVTPTEAQTVALSANQPLSFQWQVTPGTGAKGPLKASVRAQAVSAGQYLNLGDKTVGDSMLAGKIVGIGLLVVIAALILGWAVRRRPNRTQTVIRRPAYDQYPPTSPTNP